jgi:hypothetical protein
MMTTQNGDAIANALERVFRTLRARLKDAEPPAGPEAA